MDAGCWPLAAGRWLLAALPSTRKLRFVTSSLLTAAPITALFVCTLQLSLKYLKQALTLDPENHNLLNFVGYTHMQLGYTCKRDRERERELGLSSPDLSLSLSLSLS